MENPEVIIVGAGHNGLAAGTLLAKRGLRVLVLEKSANVGDHMLSGAVMNPKAIKELMPDFVEQGFPTEYVCDNDLFYMDHTRMFFGDAKQSMSDLVREVREA